MTVIANPPLVPLDAGDSDDYRPRSTFAVLADPVREDGSSGWAAEDRGRGKVRSGGTAQFLERVETGRGPVASIVAREYSWTR